MILLSETKKKKQKNKKKTSVTISLKRAQDTFFKGGTNGENDRQHSAVEY